MNTTDALGDIANVFLGLGNIELDVGINHRIEMNANGNILELLGDGLINMNVTQSVNIVGGVPTIIPATGLVVTSTDLYFNNVSMVPQVATANVALTVPITAITQATSQTIVNTTITTIATKTLCITGMITFDSNANTKHDISILIRVDTVLVGQISTSSLDGIGHFITVPAQATEVGVLAGAHIVSLEAFADTASVFQALTYTIQVLAI
jgi:hypothetical protein